MALLVKGDFYYIGVEPETAEPLEVALGDIIYIGETPVELIGSKGKGLQFLEFLTQEVYELRCEFLAVAVSETECAYSLRGSALIVVRHGEFVEVILQHTDNRHALHKILIYISLYCSRSCK